VVLPVTPIYHETWGIGRWCEPFNPIDPVVKFMGLVILGGLLYSQDVFTMPIDKNK
jgi:hypothetical protein